MHLQTRDSCKHCVSRQQCGSLYFPQYSNCQVEGKWGRKGSGGRRKEKGSGSSHGAGQHRGTPGLGGIGLISVHSPSSSHVASGPAFQKHRPVIRGESDVPVPEAQRVFGPVSDAMSHPADDPSSSVYPSTRPRSTREGLRPPSRSALTCAHPRTAGRPP